MIGFRFRIVLAFVLLMTCQATAQRSPVVHPERLLSMGDLDLDGRLSLDESRDFLREFFLGRNTSATIDPMFCRLNTDHDG